MRLPASAKTIYSYFVDMDSGNFVGWDALVPTTQSLIEKGAVITIGQCVIVCLQVILCSLFSVQYRNLDLFALNCGQLTFSKNLNSIYQTEYRYSSETTRMPHFAVFYVI